MTLMMVSVLFMSASSPAGCISSALVLGKEDVLAVEEGSVAPKVIRSTPSTPTFPHLPTCLSAKADYGRKTVPEKPRCSYLYSPTQQRFRLEQDFGESFPWTRQLKVILILLASQEIPLIPHSHTSYIVSQQLVWVSSLFQQVSNIHNARSRTSSFSLGSSNFPIHLDSI